MSVEERAPNERLRHARSLKGWSQAKLAEEVGTSFEMVSRWERGVTVPTLYFRAQLSAALGMTAEELGFVHDAGDLLTIPTSPFVFDSRHIGRQGLEQPRKALGEAIRTAQMLLLICLKRS